MLADEIVKDASEKMQKSVQALARDLARVRAGRASVSILDGVKVHAYGTEMPLNGLATLSAPDPRMIVVQPWDKGLLHEIEKAVLASDIGLTPANDGHIIRLPVPPLTTERREGLVRRVRKMAEEGRVAVRNVRRDGNNDLKELQKEKEITEDDHHRYHAEVQKVTDSFIAKVDEMIERKEKEILEV